MILPMANRAISRLNVPQANMQQTGMSSPLSGIQRPNASSPIMQRTGMMSGIQGDANVNRPQLGGFRPSYGSGTPAMQQQAIQDGKGQMQTMQQPMQQAPVNNQAPLTGNYGLAGQESALQGGLRAGVSALEQGALQGQGAIQGGLRSALSSLNQGNQQSQQMLQGGINQLGGNFGSSASSVDPMTGQPLFQQAAQGVGQYSPAGLQAQQQQAALSGSMGQEAFSNALMSNPGTNLIRQEAMDAVMNQATATGGLGGGNVLRALQDRASGLAAQDLQNQYNRAAGLSQQGLQAAGQQGQFLSQAGQQQGQLAGQNAQMQTQVGMANANNQLQAAGQRANLYGQGAQMTNQMGQYGAGMQNQAGTNIANLLSGAGQQAAGMFSGIGQQIGAARGQAGRDIAGNLGATNTGLANLINQQGSGLGDIINSGGANIANLLSGSGQADAQTQMQLAQLLSGLATGQGTQLAGIQGQIGQARADKAVAGSNALGNLAGQAAGLLGAFGMPSFGGGGGGTSAISSNQFINNMNAPGSGFTGFGV